MNEFEIIRHYFQKPGALPPELVLGIGDDAAVIQPPAGVQLVLTTDTLVEGRHFFLSTDARSIGHKALAVNLSDLAAMGAHATGFTLNLSLPEADKSWLNDFSKGLFDLAETHKLTLVGGDTVRGPLVVTITAYGWVKQGQALTRSGARVGDQVFVSGQLGNAALAVLTRLGKLPLVKKEAQKVESCLDYPQPRLALGEALHGYATSVIDISDGLKADLSHVLEQSKVGARLYASRIPISSVYKRHQETLQGLCTAVSFGDDYELCFTASAEHESALEQLGKHRGCRITRIGEITETEGLELLDKNGRELDCETRGHDHFQL